MAVSHTPKPSVDKTKSTPVASAVNKEKMPHSSPAASQRAAAVEPPLTPANSTTSSAEPTPPRQEHLDHLSLHYLDKQDAISEVRSLYTNGPVLFAAYSDGGISVYDFINFDLKFKILGHEKPVSWMFTVSLVTNTATLKSLANSFEKYIKCLTLITGCHDGYIRQLEVNKDKIMVKRELPIGSGVTCMAVNAQDTDLGRLIVGLIDGLIYAYNHQFNQLSKMSIKVPFTSLNFKPTAQCLFGKFLQADTEVLCLKIVHNFGPKKISIIIVAARRSDPVVYDLKTEQPLLTLDCHRSVANNSIFSISVFSTYIYCFDAHKTMFTYDTDKTDNPLVQTDICKCLIFYFI